MQFLYTICLCVRDHLQSFHERPLFHDRGSYYIETSPLVCNLRHERINWLKFANIRSEFWRRFLTCWWSMILIFKLIMSFLKFVGNKTKRWISKRRWQGKKHAKFSEKTNIFYPQIRTSICVWKYYRQILDFLITFRTRHCSKSGWYCSRGKQLFLNFFS